MNLLALPEQPAELLMRTSHVELLSVAEHAADESHRDLPSCGQPNLPTVSASSQTADRSSASADAVERFGSFSTGWRIASSSRPDIETVGRPNTVTRPPAETRSAFAP